ncbi:MAG: acetyltransferase [Neomegalonema sp.]|nr:acetyltransferase [Neomegalonema sp.]
MKAVGIIGAGGHARVVLDTARRAGWMVFGLFDADPARKGDTLDGALILGDDEDLLRRGPGSIRLANGIGAVPAIGDTGLGLRRKIFSTFSAAGFEFTPLAHPRATIALAVDLAAGAQVMAGAILQPGVRIGENAIVNTSACIDHDCDIGEHSHIAPGAVLCGGVKVGVSTYIGAGAVIQQGLSIGAGALIPAGSIVRRNVEPGETFLPRRGGKA